MRKLISLLFVLGLVFGLTACEKGGDADSSKDNANAEKTAEAAADTVEVPQKGKEYDPSLPIEKFPKEAWVCDMGGKSHWAAMEKPEDGKCPVCNMMLSQAGGGEGDHGDHGH